MPTYFDIAQNISRDAALLVVVHVDRCSQTFGSSPCLATGTPCYNTWSTCKFNAAYTPVDHELKFSLKDGPILFPPQTIRPYLTSAKFFAQEILPREVATINQTIHLEFFDEQDSDVGMDPYRVSPTLRSAPGGTESIPVSGTFWRKWRARNEFYANRAVEVKHGFLTPGFLESDYKTLFKGAMDNFRINKDGTVTLVVRGVLKLTEKKIPEKTDGKLFGQLLPSATTFETKSFTGIIDTGITIGTQYSPTGYVKIDNEIIAYSLSSFDATTGITTFNPATRGQFNAFGWNLAQTHEDGATIQQVTVLQGNPIDLMISVLNMAGISTTDIDVPMFEDERDLWFAATEFLGIIDEPESAKKLLSELRNETLTAIWQGEDQKIKLRFFGPLTPGATYKRIRDAENVVFRSRSLDDQNQLRVSRTSFLYDIKAGKRGSAIEDYDNVTVTIDGDAESAFEHGEARNREPIMSRWVRTLLGGDAYSRSIAQRTGRRFRDGEMWVEFECDIKDNDLAVGDIFEFESRDILDVNGLPRVLVMMAIKKSQESHGRLKFRAIDMGLSKRYGFINSASVPDYMLASETERRRMFICNAAGKMSNGDDGYFIV